MNKSHGLACWFGDQKRKNHKGLPSWVPDWSSAFDPADRRRMDKLTQVPMITPDQISALCVVETEEDHWHSATDQAKRFLDSLLKHQPSSQKLPASLKWHLSRYVEFLRVRVETLNFPLLAHAEERFVSALRWCEKNDHTRLSGPGLLRQWIQAAHNDNKIRQNLKTSQNLLLNAWHSVLEKLQTECNHEVKDGRRIQVLVSYLESLYACSQPGLGNSQIRGLPSLSAAEKSAKETKECICSLRDICKQLESLCRVKDDISDSIQPVQMFNLSHAFEGNATWMHLLHQTAFNNIFKTSYFAKFPMELSTVSSDRCITLQTTFFDTVLGVGERMLGWLDMDAATRTVAQWLQSVRGLEKSQETLHMFARTLVGGICRVHGTRSFHKCPLLDWLSVLDEDICPPPNQFLEDIQLATDNRVFFTTENGTMGLGPASTQSGDRIVNFPSGCTNFVLRPLSHQQPGDTAIEARLDIDDYLRRTVHVPTLELIGSCYVDAVECTPTPAEPDGVAGKGVDDISLEGSLPYDFLGVGYTKEMCPEMTLHTTIKLM